MTRSGRRLSRICPRTNPVRGVVDGRRVMSGVVHVLGSGCRWSDCPDEYGPSTTIHTRCDNLARNFPSAVVFAIIIAFWI